jgi:rubrerythrin
MDAFLQNQAEKWACPVCGGLLCMHRSHCLVCGAPSPYPVAVPRKAP